jgi:hypothetical protein
VNPVTTARIVLGFGFVAGGAYSLIGGAILAGTVFVTLGILLLALAAHALGFIELPSVAEEPEKNRAIVRIAVGALVAVLLFSDAARSLASNDRSQEKIGYSQFCSESLG